MDIKTLTEELHNFEPGYLPYELFVEIARLIALPIVELVPLRLNKQGNVEILLLPREKTDDIWPDMVHTPGTVVRATDVEGGMEHVFGRILSDELNGMATKKPNFVGTLLHNSRRGTELAQVYWIEIIGEPKIGQFYSVDRLPNNVIESQKKFIAQAVDSFRNSSNI